ncbi:uncharacterized protein PHACADRAFT_151051 [Phanerochaete carnosa HHB-10118-sp]|uniref:Uncharacterized protein n=1 Tax=Phanerochaete carnosa (strain HHB-10118-sp) TaxID=650164 RepID=K5VKZ9_PHACS|nr:uncharacterized protein PHACADRAFT_151051 [Phanerochaete carnosa HHB-10118-sp]EKM52083.1 hypothetical protein PHACADRAFT_151051 [Phanerochaete carnosa HHB-10118-sp]
MDYNRNSGPLSIRYVTAQLEALWRNADECAANASPSDYKSAEYEGTRYIRALREFHFLTKRPATGLREDDLFFSAKFAMPELKFLCNHTTFLRLIVESGHLNLAYKDSAKPGARADHSKNVPLKAVEVVFALPILRSNVSGRDEKVGNLGVRHLVQMMILALDQEKLVKFTAGDDELNDEAKSAFQVYLKHYLRFLQTSGNHVMFDLPDFDDNKHRPRIDYSVIRTEGTDELRQLISKDIKILDHVDPALIAQFYQMHWQNASGKRNGPAWGKLDLCLATICSDWINGCTLENTHFFINFHSPTVEPLCNQEVIIKFNIKELGFFEKRGIDENVSPTVDLSDQQWQFAFIVKCVKAEGLGVVTLDLDTARFSRFDSFFGHGEPDEQTKHYIDLMIKFFSHDYIDILARFSLHIILGLPLAPDNFGKEYEAEWTETDENEGDRFARKHTHAMMWSERIQNTTISPGCHEVVALSEETINRVLRSRLETVHEWQIDELFSIKILDLKVRLLTSGKAIIYIQANGMISVRKREKSLKWWTRLFWMRPQPTEELEKVNFDACTTTTTTPTGARYVEELSNVIDLGTDETSPEKLNTLRQYIPEYLAALTHYGHNILHTVPICEFPRVDGPVDLFAFTEVGHRVLTKKEITIDTCLNFETLETEIPLVVIYGVTGGAKMPTFSGKWAAGWQAVGPKAVGTLGLSREIFLQRYILDQLKTVNAMTTIVPSSVHVVDDVWYVDLTRWYLHPIWNQSKVGCQWKPVKAESLDHMKYEWEFRDEWNRGREGHDDDDIANGKYYLHCNTKNTLIVPTKFDPNGIELDLHGESIIKVGGKHNGQKWSRSTVGTWGAKIKLDTSNGLKIVVVPIPVQVKPTVETCTDEWTFDPIIVHRQNLKLEDDALDAVIAGQLRLLLEASWEYCVMGIQSIKLATPIITQKGDFICELDLNQDMIRLPMLDVKEWFKYRTRWYAEWVKNGKLVAWEYGQIRGEYTVDKDGKVDHTPVEDRKANGAATKAVEPAPAPAPAPTKAVEPAPAPAKAPAPTPAKPADAGKDSTKGPAPATTPAPQPAKAAA